MDRNQISKKNCSWKHEQFFFNHFLQSTGGIVEKINAGIDGKTMAI